MSRRLLLFSDVHDDLAAAERLVELARDVDVVVGAGDFAKVHRHLVETIEVLARIETPTIVVPGNNETDEALVEACAVWPAARVCHGAGAELAGASFFGLGGGIPPTPWDWSFDVEEADAARMLSGCPAGAVLVLHSPPHGHLDGTDGNHFGSPALLEAITTIQPPLAVCGHIHECWGQESRVGGTRLINPGPEGRVVELSYEASPATRPAG